MFGHLYLELHTRQTWFYFSEPKITPLYFVLGTDPGQVSRLSHVQIRSKLNGLVLLKVKWL